MKKVISIKSWQGNLRNRYPGLKRSVAIQRAMQAIKWHYWHKVAPVRFTKGLPAINPLISIYPPFVKRRGCYSYGEKAAKRD